MKLFLIIAFSACATSKESSEYEYIELTEEPSIVNDLSNLVFELGKLDTDITKALGTAEPSQEIAQNLTLDLQGYVHKLGPLVHSMGVEKEDVTLIAKNVYRQGAPKFLLTPLDSQAFEKALGGDEVQLGVLQTVYRMAAKTWQNFLNMCERHRVEG